MSPSLALLCPASGPGVGGGHVLRCLTLAQALRARGMVCVFGVGHDGAGLVKRYGGDVYKVSQTPIAALLQEQDFDVLVLDDYAIGQKDEEVLRLNAGAVAVIDDLADRVHSTDLLVDSGYGRLAEDYLHLVPADTRLLTGPAFALVRPAFAALRNQVLAKPVTTWPHRAFVSFGLSDIDGIAGRATALIRARHPYLPLDIAIASDAESLGGLQARAANDLNLRLHVDTTDIAHLMATADVAVGAGGASTWERACLGLATLTVMVADNQRPTVQGMAASGALLAVDLHARNFETAFNAALDRLFQLDVRQALRASSAKLCDGLGAERVADAIAEL